MALYCSLRSFLMFPPLTLGNEDPFVRCFRMTMGAGTHILYWHADELENVDVMNKE